MTVKKKQELSLDITGMAFGGRGIAKLDGYTVFVENAVPGDRVLAKITKKKKSYAEAYAVGVSEPSADRVAPPCRYSGTCGGCRWQFLKYGCQLAYKRQHVLEALAHIGGLRGVDVAETIPSGLIYGYRNKMEFSCSDRRWLLPSELGDPDIKKDFALGLHAPKTFDKIIDIHECKLHPDQGNRILSDTRNFMKASGYPPYGIKTHKGFWRFLMLRHSAAHDQWLVNVVTAEDRPDAVLPLAKQLMAAHDNIIGIVNNISGKKAAVSAGEFERPLAGEATLKERLGELEFEVSANSFFQTNTRGAEKLYETVGRYAGLSGGESVVDLYCGTGTIAIWLSGIAGSVLGLELAESAVADAEKNCRKNNVDNCRFIAGDVRESLASIGFRPDVLVIDPPRAGMHKDVVKKALDLATERIVYVSCNPATLARDICMLARDYSVDGIQPVDMFPHTPHIEAVAKLTRNR